MQGSMLVVLACLGAISAATSGSECSVAASEDDDLSTLQLKRGTPCSNNLDLVVCEEPFALCAQAKCIVSAFNDDLPSGLKGSSIAYCNCSYMGKNTSASLKFASSSYPAAYTDQPFDNVCKYMHELPVNGYVLSTFTSLHLQYNWPVGPEHSAVWHCTSENTVTANCDGAVCQVIDTATRTPKIDQSTWVPGDPAVCTCPIVQGAGQIVFGTVKDSKCFSPGYPGGPGCVPSVTADSRSRDSYEVMNGHGGPTFNGVIENCTGKESLPLGPPGMCTA